MILNMISFCKIILYLLIIIVFTHINAYAFNKYTEEANQQNKTDTIDTSERPFRMLKLNQLWEKAQKKLSPQKLKNLMADLKLQDKDELTLKKMKSESQDKDGLKEAELRKKLNSIINKYSLSEYFESQPYNTNSAGDSPTDGYNDDYIDKQIFRDKKLDKLWKKAEKSGLSDEQMKILKEEFRHHEDKLRMYHEIMDHVNRKEEEFRRRGDDWENSIEPIAGDEAIRKGKSLDNAHQSLKEKHKEIKESYKQLSETVLNAAGDAIKNGTEFDEEKVQQLWQLALQSDFTHQELDSIREELTHYENRIKKLRHFQIQLESDQLAGKSADYDEDISEGKHLKKKVKELNYKVIKLHNELETRIMQRHIEL